MKNFNEFSISNFMKMRSEIFGLHSDRQANIVKLSGKFYQLIFVTTTKTETCSIGINGKKLTICISGR
jgi:hypothetical protein